jgi:hypothetical protein
MSAAIDAVVSVLTQEGVVVIFTSRHGFTHGPGRASFHLAREEWFSVVNEAGAPSRKCRHQKRIAAAAMSEINQRFARFFALTFG